MRRSKRWITSLLVAVLSLTLVACGTAPDKSAPAPGGQAATEKKAEPKPVTINVLTQSIEPKPVLEEFKKAYPHITVKWEQIDTKTVRDVIKTRLAAGGEGLDIIAPQTNDYAPLAEQGTWVDLSGEADLLAHVDPAAIEDMGKVNGKVYGIPFTRQAYVVWYNKDIFKQYNLSEPKNWDEFLAVAETLKSNGVPPLVLAGKVDWLVSVFSGLPYSGLLTQDPNWITKVSNGEAKWTDEASVTALRNLKTLVDKGYLLEGALGTGEDQAYQAFYQEKAAMVVNGIWAIDRVVQNTPKFEVGVFAPAGNAKGTEPKVAFIYGNIYAVTTHSKNQEAALTFLKFLAKPENAKPFMNEIKQFTNVKGVSADFHPATRAIESVFNLQRSEMMHAKTSPSVRSILGKTLQKLIAGEATPEQVAQELQAAQNRDVKK